jgi:predicted ATPase
MLRKLKIDNFRCFQDFELQQLGRVNLLVGVNNSGKTSILEAVRLVTAQHDLESLSDVMIGRSEYVLSDRRAGIRELDIRHLFYGHRIEIGSKFLILADNHPHSNGIIVSVEQSGQLSLFEDLPELVLVIKRTGEENEIIKLPLSKQEGLPLDYVRRIRRDVISNPASRVQSITSSSITPEKMIELFDQIVLTPEENLVVEALQTIEPSIVRIAPVGSEKYRYNGSQSGFVIRLKNEEQRIPIGSMGDGLWRMLGLTLALVNARNGVLLVDEIDTGLHFSTMSDMWRLIWKTAQRLNIQVFATTHNSDCWTSLAEIARTEDPAEEGITIQRIEKGKSQSVVFTERQLVIAADRGIEVR